MTLWVGPMDTKLRWDTTDTTYKAIFEEKSAHCTGKERLMLSNLCNKHSSPCAYLSAAWVASPPSFNLSLSAEANL